ncbi:ASPIC/UnbV domain protein [Cellulophaga algicola DSM 14237]|uniref:ASPIC/UnbV domain protein n=1 Tax=Cellulophaga algicola (strain DSM 14237 / IC166 / ACAM 630) TaxID=688270 RepID=E6X902_CELAD|nr:VCBS repeat-containing protein [Cellulophaga algicola]ADV49773.1 ASPIC/UnbV domain protein [Cellulophaga algicola DSM 14237]
MTTFKSYFSIKKLYPIAICILLNLGVYSCKEQRADAPIPEEQKLFTAVSSKHSGLDFVNQLEETLDSNYYQYMYTYIGGGVAAGDINDDGYIDLYFTSNSSADKLYLNLGNFTFKEISTEAGILNTPGFNTGVTMADVNNDGLLDIYISRGGWEDNDGKFQNLLYINNGDLTFTEKAAVLGIADDNRTIQTTFFDYDNDNDLDAYVSNTPDITSRTQILDLDKIQKDPKTLELKGSDRLYNNDGTGHFTDVSEQAGLQFDIGFGLNPQVGDLNNDGWLDVYVCNDFNIPDLAYLNNKDGTFTESRDLLFKHISFNSMGSDIADINNDGLLDVLTLDMNPEDYIRSKTTMAMTSISSFEEMVDKGYHYQYMHNMLQLNNGEGAFSEISKMSGIANTDWSWSILSADFDLDGFNDIYVTNGVYRDVIDRDKNSEILQILKANNRKPTKEDFLRFAKMLPQQKLNNYFFKNNGDYTFEDTSKEWTDEKPTFSNGAIYADLDNDGDLDIVVNNINEEATVLRNNTLDQIRRYYLKIDLVGPGKNTFGIGTTVHLNFADGSTQTRQLIPTKGFLSSVATTLHFGLNKHMNIATVEVVWPDGKTQILRDVKANQSLLLNYRYADGMKEYTKKTETLFKKQEVDYTHKDPYFNDYELQILLPHKLSQTGPFVTKIDLNNDGYEDVYIGGGKGQPGQLLYGSPNNSFQKKHIKSFNDDKAFEDQGALFFDADNDGDYDLYVVSGSYEFNQTPELLYDRLYLNNGQGDFTRTKNNLPEMASSGSVVTSSDYDNDGDLDLFVGGRVVPGKYPYAPTSYLLINTEGNFTIKTPELAPDLEKIGMVTDAIWSDINNDNKIDLVVTGEWMGIEIFINKNNQLIRSLDYPTLANAKGWWNKLLVEDIDNDGNKDIIAGNLGLNYKFHASKEDPFEIYTNDFDFNGIEDIILAKDYQGKQVPVRGKSCMTQQLPHLSKKIPSYIEYANKNVEEIVGARINTALHYTANEFRSGIFRNNGSKGYHFTPLANALQKSPINSMLYEDFNGDGTKDLLLAGNNYQSEVETTRADAGIGSFLSGDGNGHFNPVSNKVSGFFANKDVRSMISVTSKDKKLVLVINNNDKAAIYNIRK